MDERRGMMRTLVLAGKIGPAFNQSEGMSHADISTCTGRMFSMRNYAFLRRTDRTKREERGDVIQALIWCVGTDYLRDPMIENAFNFPASILLTTPTYPYPSEA